MAVGDRQKLITDIVATVLKERAQTDISFDWFINIKSIGPPLPDGTPLPWVSSL